MQDNTTTYVSIQILTNSLFLMQGHFLMDFYTERAGEREKDRRGHRGLAALRTCPD